MGMLKMSGNVLPAVVIVASTGRCSRAGEGRQAVRGGRVVLAGAQPLRHAHLRVLGPSGLAGRLQQPAGLLVPAARRIPAAMLGIPAATGSSLVEIPTALPRNNVQGGDVF